MELFVRILALCLVLATVEMLHGIVRVRFVVSRLGRIRAQQVSIVTGSLLAVGVCWLLVPSLGIHDRLQLLAVGFTLALFMASFDIAVARWLMHRPWSSIPQDFDPRKGNYLVFGLAILVMAPNMVMAFHAPS
jgi:hypothetical protein